MVSVSILFGSSPLARGTLNFLRESQRFSRLIPARAGSTDPETDSAQKHAAHPRSRGEHFEVLTHIDEHGGSSPLARGAQRVPAGLLRGLRLIPARAGNTKGAKRNESCIRAHPRSRGEHQSEEYRDICAWGSSPLARGTRNWSRTSRRKKGLIPARTGNTSTESLESVRDAAHPRSRGEHAGSKLLAPINSGSSPLSRGTLHNFAEAGTLPRLIPAHAENTATATSAAFAATARPH